jgi:hypothetical protein
VAGHRGIIGAAALAALLGLAAPAVAQGTGTSSSTGRTVKPPAPKLPIGYRALFTFDTSIMTAKQSFEAVTGSTAVFGYGGVFEVLNVWRTLFVRVGVAQGAASGERAVPVNGGVLLTGIPIDLGLRTIEVGAGWRVHPAGSPKVVFHVGGGLLMTGYSETSPGGDQDVSETFRGYAAQAGLEFVLSNRIVAGVEGQFRTVPNALGDDGLSRVFGETDLGGFVIRAMVGFRVNK